MASHFVVAAEPWFKEFSHDIQVKAERKNIPGYTFALIEKGKPATVVVYGKESKSGAPIALDTVFRLASVSKTFTSMLMAKFVEHNQLDWQAPVSSFVPQFELAKKPIQPLSLQHIIGQSSGYTPNAYDNLIEANYPVERVLTMLANLKPLCKPGECYTYQNTLFAVVEEYFSQHNSSYKQALQNALIQPLNMPYASVGKQALQSSKKWAKPHVAISKNGWRKTRVRDDYYRYSPAAGVNASMRDMIIWMRALMGETPQVVSADLVKQVTRPLTKSKKELYRSNWRKHLTDAHYGLGWRIYQFEGETLNYHGGWVKGYRADVAFAPDFGAAYVMLMNAESNLINELTPDFWQRYFKQAKQSKLTATLTR
ncbi:beta-lactamase family protein [Paraglaciecola aquimarina]|uniref:Beta-lactamase family protein n=1 Tax=Paraglaciecola algarum TaxID=3050085 RepID=A0ABS9D3L8_9ALTE|nr:serine hydrolase domain-containing protein [Paraglaciecola sp. G1-23]MCF2947525.1 beta-lactamase family protein [Paraglaciecola sp. G1-23]